MLILSAVWSLLRDEVIAALAVSTTALPLASSGWSIPITRIDTTAQAVVSADGILGWLGFKTVVDVHHQTINSIPAWTVPAVGILFAYGVRKTRWLYWWFSPAGKPHSWSGCPANPTARADE
jgi:hypothetical protein